jgi:hypothetical protein
MYAFLGTRHRQYARLTLRVIASLAYAPTNTKGGRIPTIWHTLMSFKGVAPGVVGNPDL